MGAIPAFLRRGAPLFGPTAAPGGNSYLLHGNADGSHGYTNPSTFATPSYVDAGDATVLADALAADAAHIAASDPHSQYAKADKSRPSVWVSAADLSIRSLADLGTRSAADLSSGTLLDARLSSNVPLLNAANTFTAGPQAITAGTGDSLLALTSNLDTPHFLRGVRGSNGRTSALLTYSGTGGGVLELNRGSGSATFAIRLDADAESYLAMDAGTKLAVGGAGTVPTGKLWVQSGQIGTTTIIAKALSGQTANLFQAEPSGSTTPDIAINSSSNLDLGAKSLLLGSAVGSNGWRLRRTATNEATIDNAASGLASLILVGGFRRQQADGTRDFDSRDMTASGGTAGDMVFYNGRRLWFSSTDQSDLNSGHGYIYAPGSRTIGLHTNDYVRITDGTNNLDMKPASLWSVPANFGFAIAGGSKVQFLATNADDLLLEARNSIKLNAVGANTAAKWNFYNNGTLTHVLTTTGLGINTAADPVATVDFVSSNAATSTVVETMRGRLRSTGTPADGFGSRWLRQLKSSTTNDQDAAADDVIWATAAHATRKARRVFSVADASAMREVLRMEADGSAARIGFFGAAAVTRRAGWSGTGFSALRVWDSGSITLQNLSDVVVTLVQDLQALGLLGA